jgi:hypothetical protein
MSFELKFGKPDSYDYNTLLDQFSGTKINSVKTSSIPLVQFWKNTDKRLTQLGKYLDLNLDQNDLQLCFEYPTVPGQGKGKASMTDLMILAGDTQIAIEAKYTEYRRAEEKVEKWRTKNGNNRQDVLQGWWDMIANFRTVPNTNDPSIAYQFLHRTASACKGAKKDVQQAIVVYQIFHDTNPQPYLDRFKKRLQKYVNIIKPEDSKLKFYTWEIEVIPPIPDKIDPNPFIEMKTKPVYTFGKQDFNQLTVTN